MIAPIDLFVIPLQPRSGDLELLDAREAARAARLAVERKRAQFVAAQAALRRILGARLELQPQAIEFAYGRWGKPQLLAHPGLGFNLSHSDDLALVAVGEGTEIGVDVEATGRSRPFRRLARRYFAPGEQAWIERLGDADVAAGFYRTWTLKEAYLKAIGTGLSVSPERFAVHLQVSPAWLQAPAPGYEEAGPWHFAEPQVGARFAAAVCWRGEGRPLQVRAAAELQATEGYPEA